jgi:hypothetical protein
LDAFQREPESERSGFMGTPPTCAYGSMEQAMIETSEAVALSSRWRSERAFRRLGAVLRFKGSLQHLMFMTQVEDLSVLLLVISIPGFYAVCNLVRLRRHQVRAVCIG